MHVYASLAEFKDYLQQNGSTVRTSATDDAQMLGVLESVSRRIDEWAGRGSGFGPEVATRYYDTCYEPGIHLDGDLGSGATVTLGGSSLTVDVDYDLLRGDGTYGDPPYRRIRRPLYANLGYGRKNLQIDVTNSYPYLTRVLNPTTAEALDDSETVIDVSALTGISPGMTLLLGPEQVYVSATTDSTNDTITVDRGVNGTTAASHLTAAAIVRQVYPGEVTECALRLWGRRWAARSAGADGADGGGQVGITTPRESEDTILRRTIGHLRLIDARSISFGRRADAE